jgi:hypothetical protein
MDSSKAILSRSPIRDLAGYDNFAPLGSRMEMKQIFTIPLLRVAVSLRSENGMRRHHAVRPGRRRGIDTSACFAGAWTEDIREDRRAAQVAVRVDCQQEPGSSGPLL